MGKSQHDKEDQPDDGPLSSLRTTQRAPRSCRSCSARKVRCDKAVPCSKCIRRGEADKCVRETVIVRGQVTTGKDPGSHLTYDELLSHIEKLRNALVGKGTEPCDSEGSETLQARRSILEDEAYYDNVLFKTAAVRQPTDRMHQEDVILPDRLCSDALIAYDKTWNLWVHYAIEYPRFELEHGRFWDQIEAGVSIEEVDACWLALYFAIITAALLAMEGQMADELGLPLDDPPKLQRNWYEASLLFLDKSNFLRQPRLRTVQTIAVLGISFVNFGDHELYATMWACAIRIAQAVGLNKVVLPDNDLERLELSQYGRHRLWWTLVICDWLELPCATSLIGEQDFDVPLPMVDGNNCITLPDGSRLHPVQYHIFMARTSAVYHRFRMALRTSYRPISDIVRTADEELAEIIATLPHHLQPDGVGCESTDLLGSTYPWARWQQVYVTLILLHIRLRINRILQKSWAADPAPFAWARAICQSTVRDTLWIIQHWERPPGERRQWPFVIYLFSIAIFIAREAHIGSGDQKLDWREEVSRCISHLDEIKSRNAVAGRASEVLQGLMGHNQLHDNAFLYLRDR